MDALWYSNTFLWDLSHNVDETETRPRQHFFPQAFPYIDWECCDRQASARYA